LVFIEFSFDDEDGTDAAAGLALCSEWDWGAANGMYGRFTQVGLSSPTGPTTSDDGFSEIVRLTPDLSD
jgi:hypothetical protein